MQMTDEMQTHDGEHAEFLNNEDATKVEECDDDELEKKMRGELGEYVEANTRLDIVTHNRIDYERQVDGYVQTAERFDCDELEAENCISIYTNNKKAWVMLERCEFVGRWELEGEVRVECDDEKTVADAVNELLQ